MTLNTKTELELRPLEGHELDLVNGGGIPMQQPASHDYHLGVGPFLWGPFQWDVIWFALIPNAQASHGY
ncbi:MAG: hypothetical protein C5B56_02940 [Proteobacteria bacterium]|nr:MAG: hypothetical protein C5B56_02940 [Pseudomonadota bacterium]